MDAQTLIIVAVIAAVAFFIFRPKGGGDAAPATAGPAAAGGAAPAAPAAALGDLAAYRKAHPSNQIQGKVTCHHCGSNRISAGHCDSCHSTLFRA